MMVMPAALESPIVALEIRGVLLGTCPRNLPPMSLASVKVSGSCSAC